MSKYPVLLAEENKDGTLKAWCPYCAKYHQHGIDTGLVQAHCFPESPFSDTGYILRKK